MSRIKLMVAISFASMVATTATPAHAEDWRDINTPVTQSHYVGLNAWDFGPFHDAMRAAQSVLPVSANAQVGFGVDYGISSQSLWLVNNGFAGLDVGFAGFEMPQANYHYVAVARVDDNNGQLTPGAYLHSWDSIRGYTEIYNSYHSNNGAQTPGYYEPLMCQFVLAENRSFGMNTSVGWLGVNGTISGTACRGVSLLATPLSGVRSEVTVKPDAYIHLGASAPGATLFGYFNITGDSEAQLRVHGGYMDGLNVCVTADGYGEFYDLAASALTLFPGGNLLSHAGFDWWERFQRNFGCHYTGNLWFPDFPLW